MNAVLSTIPILLNYVYPCYDNHMKLVSWNVNGIRACHRKGCFNWFFEYQPDFFCLQEIKCDVDQVPDELKEPAGYQAFFDVSKEKKGYSGVAIYSKYKPLEVRYGLGLEKFDQEGRCIGLRFKDFWLFNVYFPNGGGGPHRLEFKLRYYDKFLALIERLRKNGTPVIFCGDVNTAHEEIDLARPKENEKNTGFLPVERAWIDKIISKGYIDTFRHFFPEKKHTYSYWDQKSFARERNVGWRIDYFFASKDLEGRLKGVQIFDSVLGSDHCPIGLDIE